MSYILSSYKLSFSALLLDRSSALFSKIRCLLPVMKDKTMELLLIIVLLFVLFGGGFGFYRGGYYRQGGPVGIGGILGLIAIVLVIGWLVHGHIGGVSL